MGPELTEKAAAFYFFRNHREALFVRRPNRFLIIAQDGDEELSCHCPNPGRLLEFAIPGSRLILEKREMAAPVKAKTAWTAAGIYYRRGCAPLFSSRANAAAEKFLLHHITPGLKEIHREYSIGGSRFDFFCIDALGERHLVEVKACSLVEHNTAMFPDAPSSRALKHLEELADLASKGWKCHILFVIVHGSPKVFIPNLHTDPRFAAALCRHGLEGTVAVHASLLRCGKTGKTSLAALSVPLDLSHGELARGDGGNYLILLKLKKSRNIGIGALGRIEFQAGWYIYAGSARKNLSRRINRHLRKTGKKLRLHWHIDYLTPWADKNHASMAFPIYSYRNLECDLAAALGKIGGQGISGFGSSDCRCSSHLYYFSENPLQNRAFLDMLFRFRHVEGFKDKTFIDRTEKRL